MAHSLLSIITQAWKYLEKLMRPECIRTVGGWGYVGDIGIGAVVYINVITNMYIYNIDITFASHSYYIHIT